ncbi:type II secretion system protein [Candidatus Peregrinibacteria bacterium]|nr:type II secretion system protein [Candidatus Peregrinibacteria bacterium]
MLKKYFKKGFSLVELLVVITIMAILSVAAYSAFGGQTSKARNSRRLQDLSSIQSSLEIYFIEHNNKYPGSLAELVPNLMPQLPTDPSSTEATTYNYKYEPKPVTLNKYQIAATIENEDGTYEAYIMGNSPDNLITGVGGCTVSHKGACLPYSF